MTAVRLRRAAVSTGTYIARAHGTGLTDEDALAVPSTGTSAGAVR